MKTTPLISILTPCYNSSQFLRECIESILQQDYPHIEHLLIDDGSTDSTRNILHYYAKKYSHKVKCYYQKHQGQPKALNSLLKKAKGELFLNLNSDDVLLPHACSWARNAFEKYFDLAVIYGDEYIINEDSHIINSFTPQNYNFNKVLCSELVIPEQAAFIKRQAFLDTGLYYDTSISKVHDFEFMIRIGLKHKIKHLPGFVSKYRWHKRSGGKQYTSIDIFLSEKRQVLERIMADPNLPRHLKKLKKRADVGLMRWAAEMRRGAYGIKSHQLPTEPLISVVTPTYNNGSYIKECIDSVLNQHYPYVEHIIQDGKSTDNSYDVIKPYLAEEFKGRIKWVSEKDRGQADGLDKALKRTSGEIILVLNGDDALLPHACSWAVSNMRLFPNMAAIYGDEYIIDKNGSIIKIAYAGEYSLEKLLCVELVPPAQATFIRRSYLEQVGLGADPHLDTCPDFEMWIRLAIKFPKQIIHIPGVVSKYRSWEHPDSHAQRSAFRFFKAKKSVIDKSINNPGATDEVKALKYRAYAGLAFWTAQELFKTRNFSAGLILSVYSLILFPSRRKLNYLIHIFRDSPLVFIVSLLRLPFQLFHLPLMWK